MSDTPQTVPYTAADPALAVGTHHAGFTVTKVEPLPELSGMAYVMRHDATGARALWLAIDDNNKSFSIAFKTPPADNTGVFHILEHSVLCGSERFPVKEPFVNLLKTSMQTFLNALTFPDKTMYPVASTNTADLENLMDVYLDAVLQPAIYKRPRIFEQEGWHLELAPAEEGADEKYGPLSYNGVVFNEMKGALSDPDDVLFQAIGSQLFPDSAYGFESGGNPRAIPTLSYEGFLDAHARHYNLANSYTILYGNLDIDRELAFIGERFAQAPVRTAGAPNPLVLQRPVTPALKRIEMATAPENASVGLAYVIGTADQRERVLATDVLLDTLAGSNESPLKRVVLDSGLGDDFSATLIDSELQPQVLFVLKGAKPGVAQRFRELVESACAQMADSGIDRERLSASLAQCEFNLRENDWGSYGDGVALSMQSLASWLYDDERPVDYLRYEDAMDSMRAGLDDGYFERLLRELVCESSHNALVDLVPVQEGSATEEAAELAELRSHMSEAELDHVASEVAALRAEQEAPDSPEDLAKLPQLTVADIEDAPEEAHATKVEAPLPCLYHALPTHKIDYVYHYFGLDDLAFEDLPYVGVLSALLGNLDTASRSAAELDTLVEKNLGNLDFFSETYAADDDLDDARPYLVVGTSALSERIDSAATIPSEVWSSTQFSDTDRMLALLTQKRIALSQYFVGSGHAAAMKRLTAHYAKSAVVAEALGGIDFYFFLKDLLANWDARKDDLRARLDDLSRRIFTSDHVLVSFTGSREDLEAFWKSAGALGLKSFQGQRRSLQVPEPVADDEAFVIPSNVSYVAEGAGARPKVASVGTWQVAARALSFDYLWNEVRVKGGAYGTGFRHTVSQLDQFWSYRDPNVDATLDRYEAAESYLRGWNPSPTELDGYVVSVVAAHDAPAKSRAIARRQDGEHFIGRPATWRADVRDQELAVSAEDVRGAAASLAGLHDSRSLVVFGPREAIEASGTKFLVRDMMDSE
ncbi:MULTISPECIES: insulinase family protein [Atopobiaceae]|uniref:Peptidase M16C associated domain-containing protein n=1 Tax=Parafannyhessea umbonata TaxID=604330 RepID=A0A1H6HKK3_9ACTN|nr:MULTISPECIES: insulinase family protein [Atopobiaceae]SEH36327.1 hypothetical protein SAMN05216447_10140 [Parafannyhessea umbonata]SJZ37744.1 hypothetical protein SAMN06298223_0053 [Olsenella sp. KH1P3]